MLFQALGCLLYKLCYFSLPFGESSLAITSAKYNIPDASKYSLKLQKLISKKWNPVPSIFQFSFYSVQFILECPV